MPPQEYLRQHLLNQTQTLAKTVTTSLAPSKAPQLILLLSQFMPPKKKTSLTRVFPSLIPNKYLVSSPGEELSKA